MRIFYKKLISCATVMAILSSATVMATPYSDIYLKEGENRAIINGKVVEIEGKAPVEIDGTLMVPLRFFAEQLGKNVIWEDGFVSISDDETPPSQKDYLISQLVGAPLPSYNDDMQIMTNNLSGAVKNPNADPKDALAKMKPDGSFEGVEYFNSDRDKWTASEHLKYIRTMVQSAYSEGNPLFGNVELKANIAKALEFWANGKIVDSDNWWHKEIGIPNIIVDILLLQPEEVNGEISDLLNAQALEGSIFKEKITDRITERPVKSSGGNLTDKLVTSMKIAVATKNAEELYKVIQLTENELRVFMKIRADEFGEDAEGIKADYSFHQHVDQVQFGGYGEVFVSGINQILKATAGTAFMVSDRALNEYANFILDGMQWSFKGEYKDFTTTGRGFSRQNGNKGIYKPVKAAT
ncbi:MAG: stalk domain-containing protein, partial [Oscillospiraceae bacterium]